MNERTAFFFVAALALLLTLSLVAHGFGFVVLPHDGPPARIAEAAKSLWDNSSLQAPEFEILRRSIAEMSREAGLPSWQDAFSLGRNGELYPKHAILSVFMAAPFYGVFGEAGFWILQQLAVLFLLYCTFRLLENVTGNRSPLITLAVIFLATQLSVGLYSYIFSYDVHGALYIMWGILVMRRYPALGGALSTLSALVRPSNGLILPILAFCWWDNKEYRVRKVLRVYLGMAVGLLGFCGVNWWLWGGAFTTSYHRITNFVGAGAMFMSAHDIGFSFETLKGRWFDKLLDPKIGLLVYNPVFFLAPLVVIHAAKSPNRRFFLTVLAAGLLNIIYIFSYQAWKYSFLGNRFIMPALFLFLLPCLDFIECGIKRCGEVLKRGL